MVSKKVKKKTNGEKDIGQGKKLKDKTKKNKKEMKKFAKFLSGKDVEFQIKDKTISMYVEGVFLCGFTGSKIMAEDYRKEKKALDKREQELDKSEKKLIDREEKLFQRENKLEQVNGNLKKLKKLAKLDKKRNELIESIES